MKEIYEPKTATKEISSNFMGSSQIVSQVIDQASKAIDQSQDNTQQVYRSCDEVMEKCSEELTKDNLSPEQRCNLINVEKEMAEMKNEGAARHQNHVSKIFGWIVKGIVGLATVVGGVFLGKYAIDSNNQNK